MLGDASSLLGSIFFAGMCLLLGLIAGFMVCKRSSK